MSDQETLTKELFATLVQKLLAGYCSESWTFDPGSFSLLTGTSSDPGTADTRQALSLANLYQVYANTESPQNLLELQRQLRVLLTPAPMASVDNLKVASNPLSRLLPCMRSYVSFQNDKAQAQALFPDTAGHPAAQLVFFPYADVLGVGLVVDKGEKVQHIREVELEQLGLSVEDAIDLAVSNLQQISTGSFRLVQAGFYTSPWKDTYDGARLLLTDLFSNLEVDGEAVALTPTPDTLFVTGSRDTIGLQLMIQIGTTMLREPHSTMALPLVLRDGLWESFVIPISDPAFDTINTYRLNVLKELYATQEGLLKASTDEPEPAPEEPEGRWELTKGKPELTWELVKPKPAIQPKRYLSPFVLTNDKSRGYLYSRSTVLDGTISMVTECDIVEFFLRDAKKTCVARAPFGKVLEVLSDTLLKDPTLYPARWRLNNFPQQAQLSALGIAPPTCGYWSLPGSTPPDMMEELEAIVNIAIPKDAQLTSKADSKNKESTLEFIVTDTTDDLKAFYLKNLKVGSLALASTEQGQFTIAESLGAACTREAWFGPSKAENVTLLRLIKRVNFSTPSVHNAFIKQSESLHSLEQLFGISLPENVKPQDGLIVTKENASQNFLTKDSPDTVLQFFRVQMSGPSTVYIPADKETPHIVLKMNAGLIATVSTEKSPEGTQFSLSKSLEK